MPLLAGKTTCYNNKMILADREIKKALSNKKIIIRPLPELTIALSACSLDLRLDNHFEVLETTHINCFDIKKTNKNTLNRQITVKNDAAFILQPGEFALASTYEWVELPSDIAGRLEGRSSLGRLGIIVHSTAALIHPGFKGRIVLELSNLSPIAVALYPGMRICALSFEELTSPAEQPYYKQVNAKYPRQKGIIGSKINSDR